MNPIAINPDPDIRVLEIDDDNRCVVVDDFLADPAALITFAVSRAADFELQAVGYPGVLYDVEDAAMQPMRRFMRSRLSPLFGFFKGDIRMATYLSMATRQPGELAPLQRLCHSDPRPEPERRNFAALVYLFDEPRLGGTGFYRWTRRELIEQATARELAAPGSSLPLLQEHLPMYRDEPCYMQGSNDAAELLLEIPARFNRLVFYSGEVPHSAHIPEPGLLTGDVARGRLTLNCFASVRPR